MLQLASFNSMIVSGKTIFFFCQSISFSFFGPASVVVRCCFGRHPAVFLLSWRQLAASSGTGSVTGGRSLFISRFFFFFYTWQQPIFVLKMDFIHTHSCRPALTVANTPPPAVIITLHALSSSLRRLSGHRPEVSSPVTEGGTGRHRCKPGRQGFGGGSGVFDMQAGKWARKNVICGCRAD